MTCMAIDGFMLMTGSDDHSIRLWNLLTFQPASILGHHEREVQALLFVEKVGLLFSVDREGSEVFCWVYKNSKIVDKFSRPGEQILSLESVQSAPAPNHDLNSKAVDPTATQLVDPYENHLYLLLGCESGNILTQDISKFLYYDDYD